MVIRKTLMILGFILIVVNLNKAQSMNEKLDQVELMKQFIGTWKCEFDDETKFISENEKFGNGLVCNSKVIKNGKIVDRVIQLYGYDKKADKFIIAELKESSPNMELCQAWFTSENKGEIIITNPENSPLKFRFEFKTPDMIVQKAIQDGNVTNEIMLIRE
ncbi:MAG: hypothetical protein IPH62_19275 [Ignavibacteriae bacterium]|nr:hypothetical protein [Ignavibacteriota bacterium]